MSSSNMQDAPAEQPNSPRTSNAPEPLEQQVRRAREECNQLRLQAELARLGQEIDGLRHDVDARNRPALTPLADNSSIDAPLEEGRVPAAAHAPDDNLHRAVETHPIRSSLRPKEPNPYSGKSLKEHREFIRDCRIAFQLTPENYPTEPSKVLYAMQYLQHDPRDAWWVHYDNMRQADDLNFDDFSNFLLNELSDPINRGLDTAMRYHSAGQRKDQNVCSFTTYLETLEAQLEPYSENHRVQHLYAKLRPEIQTAITDFHQVPSTRSELISLAMTLERNLQRKGALRAPDKRAAGDADRPSKRHRPAMQQRKGSPHRAQSERGKRDRRAQRDVSEVTCYNCNKKGHYSTTCPDKKDNPNHQPVGQVVGKDSATRDRRSREGGSSK